MRSALGGNLGPVRHWGAYSYIVLIYWLLQGRRGALQAVMFTALLLFGTKFAQTVVSANPGLSACRFSFWGRGGRRRVFSNTAALAVGRYNAGASKRSAHARQGLRAFRAPGLGLSAFMRASDAGQPSCDPVQIAATRVSSADPLRI